MALDVARCTARALGVALAREGAIDDPEDVFFLCLDELKRVPPGASELVAFRRARHSHYDQLELPEYWEGKVKPRRRGTAEEAGNTVQGIGVTGGVVEGHVRVVLDPLESDALEPGEILVCHTTDPSWASYFFVAAGAVIDVGGPLSHGAIVCRELGIPCVINARTATRQLRTGDRVRVDGASGQVIVLSPSG
jgi:pyruvate,water dikinase